MKMHVTSPSCVSLATPLFSTLTWLSIMCFLLLSMMTQAQTLRSYADPLGKFIGTAVNNDYLEGNNNNHSNYESTLRSEFNCVVAENAFKMSYLLPNRPSDPFNVTINDFSSQGLARVDAMLQLAGEENMYVRGHAYIWYNQAPSWLNSEAPNWTDQQVYDFAASYIQAFGQYCAGKVDEWDVVNEAIDDSGNQYRTADTWYAGVSSIQDFIDHCFNSARQADPNSKLFYNDYNIETTFNGGKHTFMKNMVAGMVDRDVALDGVGLQSHFVSGYGNNTNDAFIDAVGQTIDDMNDLGLECNITELDLRICGGTDQGLLEEQAYEFGRFAEIWLAKPNCTSLLVWGVSDANSWIPQFFSGCDDGLLFDDNMNKKPGYSAILDVLAQNSLTDNLPFDGTIALPGVIEFENYDLGGNGISYSDNDTPNNGNEYRSDQVDIAGTSDMGGGYVVGWTEGGEWLEYTVDVAYDGVFDFNFRFASEPGGGSVSLFQNGVEVATEIPFGSSGGWTTFENAWAIAVPLTEGESILRVSFVSGAVNMNSVEVTPSLPNSIVEPVLEQGRIYPNPVETTLHIEVPEPTQWTLYSAVGAPLLSGVSTTVSCEALPQGTYLLSVGEKKYTLVKK